MTRRLPLALLLTLPLAALAAGDGTPPAAPNQMAGTWRMVSATLETGGRIERPYGPTPRGMLVFTDDLHFVEVLTDAGSPRFASDARGGGTDEENRRAMASSIGFFGTYTVDAAGRFQGNRVEGATFPNWIGAVRTTADLDMRVEGDCMFETFLRPDGGRLQATFVRASAPAAACSDR
ncbi:MULTISPECIES: lipocalin-like domain-containing protein [Luteimonas]|uniref:lipocalin-like domain-containing protein n=1 Tax=Luteimonas TaxID=83614 RepID=UPI000C7AB588|nr:MULTISPECIES: lipocalin-like domain-containing protein [Luteimonas]